MGRKAATVGVQAPKASRSAARAAPTAREGGTGTIQGPGGVIGEEAVRILRGPGMFLEGEWLWDGGEEGKECSEDFSRDHTTN